MLGKLDKTTDSESIGYFTSEHLKMSGAYWCLGSYLTLGTNLESRRESLVKFVKEC